MSNNAANAVMNRALVIPISSQTKRVYPGEALIELNGETRKAMSDQLTTASKQRFKSRMGVISAPDMARIEGAVLLQLGIKM